MGSKLCYIDSTYQKGGNKMSYWFSTDPEDGKIFTLFTQARDQLISGFIELCDADALARLEIELGNLLDGHFGEYYYINDYIRFTADRNSTRIRCNFPGENKMDYFDTPYIHQILRDYNAYYDAEKGRVRPPYRYEDDTWDKEDPWVRRRKRRS